LPNIHRETTMLDVVEAIEGPMRFNICLTSDRACARQEWCPALEVWANAQAAVAQVLRGKTITDLAETVAARKHVPVSSTPRWN
jgi:DNA-binding IscR family transcriptional regulator